MTWSPPGDVGHRLDKVTKGGRGHKGHLYPHKPPAAELGTVLGASFLSAAMVLAPAQQLFEESSFSLMSSTLVNITITAESEGKERKRRRIKQTFLGH